MKLRRSGGGVVGWIFVILWMAFLASDLLARWWFSRS